MSTAKGKSVAFIGLGIMGGSMAANLVRAGAAVKGWNRTADRPGVKTAASAGVVVEPTIEAALKDATVVFSCVGDETDAEQVLVQSVAPHAKPGTIIVDMSTIGPKAARQINEALKQKNLHFLDAPVTGGDVGAREGTLTILVGGDANDFAECKPLFEAMGKRIVHCGPSGAGQAMKLCNQILCAVNMSAVSEAFALASDMGIDKAMLIEALSQGAGGSWALSNLGPRIAKSDFAPGFTLDHMLKDLRLVNENLGTDSELPATALAVKQFEKAKDMDTSAGGRQGTQAMYRVYEN
jgi:3-hydroxyisobutyrate dehydrogenase